MRIQENRHPSLENLIISENLGVETLHPGGLNITTELAELCKLTDRKKVLDELGLERFCCRTQFLGHVDLIDSVAQFKKF